jgi:hypothetical protein
MPLTAAAQILASFASDLGVSDRAAHKIPNDENISDREVKITNLLLAWEDEDECDFSSFPSLSLEESPGNYHSGVFHNRRDVESHVESLLARPILLGKQEGSSKNSSEGDPEDSLDEFLVDSSQQVPKLMLENFGTSFNTLMNSRLRAYANFLARHALSHVRCSKTQDEMEGVTSIERKLKTMLGIGHQVSAASIVSEFTADPSKCTEEIAEAQEDSTQDWTFQASMPLKMSISIDIALPHVEMEGGDETLTVTFETTGKICGKLPNRLNVHCIIINQSISTFQTRLTS